MVEWLKSSIPGVILLGAIGSLLAVGLLKLTSYLIRRHWRPTVVPIALRLFAIYRSPQYIAVRLRDSGDARQVIAACTLWMCGFLLFTLSSAVGVVIFFIGISGQGSGASSELGSAIATTGSGLAFFSLFVAADILWDIFRLYRVLVGDIEDKAIQAASTLSVQGPGSTS